MSVVRRLLGSPLAFSALVAAIVILVGMSLLLDRDRRAAVSGALPGEQGASESYAQLVAKNYRVLTAAQTDRLLEFASAFHSCMSRRGVQLGAPQPLHTKIEMAVAPGTDRQRLLRLGVACGEVLGGPPRGASLQTGRRSGTAVVLYLPKRCLLDQRVVQ